MALELKRLQNGSDIRGIALEGIENEHVNLGRAETEVLMKGFVRWLKDRTGLDPWEMRISVGHDPRLSSEDLGEWAVEALRTEGVNVLDCGQASTPAMFMSTVFDEFKCDGAVMITASHLPWNRNGFKFFGREGGLDKKDIASIIDYAEKLAEKAESETDSALPPAVQVRGAADKVDLMGTYEAYLRTLIIMGVQDPEDPDHPLKNLKIAVDAGNGGGGFFAKNILAPLGADISGSVYLEPDGHFPNHRPNPEDKEAMKAISKAVLDSGSDFGLIFDTDVDRSAAVDGKGKEIARNGIVALAAALIAVDHPGTTVVTDSITSDELTEYLTECLGLKHLRFKRGYRNVINKAIDLNLEGIDSQLAIETSGHAAYRENFWLDDGAYLAAKIVIKAAQLKRSGASISDMISSLKEPLEAMEVRLPVEGREPGLYADQVLAGLKVWVKYKEESGLGISLVEPNYEGVRINFRLEGLKGWCLLRRSLHEPLMPLNIEVTEGKCE
ncbi:MAG: phosphomannomutase/phosphoglucomutase, partial [Firmicutes bacterium]|nr:phosphomannomutase/phosphoglucomutase [Bacillota bacterium]